MVVEVGEAPDVDVDEDDFRPVNLSQMDILKRVEQCCDGCAFRIVVELNDAVRLLWNTKNIFGGAIHLSTDHGSRDLHCSIFHHRSSIPNVTLEP